MMYDDALEDDERDLHEGRDEEHDDIRDEDDESGSRDGQDDERPDADEDGGHDEESAEGRRKDRVGQRKREKERRRQARERDQRLIQEQARRIEQLEAAVGTIAQRTDLGQLDTAIAQSQAAYRAATEKLRNAKEAGDFDAELAAQEEWYTARRRAEELAARKEAAVRQPARQPQGAQPDRARVAAYADQFKTDHRWFRPDGADEDSRAAIALSEAVAQDGYPADTPAHWQELNRRLRAERPHLFAPAKPKQPPGRTPVGGAGGSRAPQGGSADERRIPREYREMLEQTGDWHDPKRRKAMIDEYFASAKRHGV